MLRPDDRDLSATLPADRGCRAMVDGELPAGERLPSARALAESLGVNMHTVLRGYAALESEGLVQMRRSRGVTVCAQPQGRARLYQLARQLVDEARDVGIDQQDLLAMISEIQ